MSERSVVFYFDPISPYAWLAAQDLPQIELQGLTIECRPVLFAGLLDAHGQKGPAEIAAKRVALFRDVMRLAAQRAIGFSGPPSHPFNPLYALRMCTAVHEREARRRLAVALMNGAWAARPRHFRPGRGRRHRPRLRPRRRCPVAGGRHGRQQGRAGPGDAGGDRRRRVRRADLQPGRRAVLGRRPHRFAAVARPRQRHRRSRARAFPGAGRVGAAPADLSNCGGAATGGRH
jgi:hypothetical protein